MSPATPNLDHLHEQLTFDGTRRTTIGNGLTVVHAPVPESGLVSAQVWLMTGSMHEGKWLGSGLSHFLEHMLFKGTARRPGAEIAREVQALGGYINAYTTFDRTVYYIDGPAEATGQILDLLADMVFAPTLPQEEMIKEMDVIRREIDMGEDDYDRKLSEAVFLSAFREHPYRHPIIGYRPLFDQLTHADLVAYHRARYQPANAVLILAGDVTEEELREHAKPFEAIPEAPLAPVEIPVEPPQLGSRAVRLEQDVSTCRGVLAWRVPGLAHPDAPALDLLSSILGQGRSSRLWQSLREERNLVHDIDLSCWNPREAGLLWCSYTCDLGRREVVEAAILEELEKLMQAGFEAAELEKARAHALNSEVNGRRTVSGLASRLGMAEVVAGDLKFPQTYLRRLQSVTREVLPQLLARTCREDQCTRAVLTRAGQDTPGAADILVRKASDYQLETLPNGVRLLWQIDRRLPRLALRHVGLGGPVYDPTDKRGATSLMATLMTRDTARHSAREVARQIEQVGGSFRDFTGNNSFGFGLGVLKGAEGIALERLSEALLEPAFDPETVTRERDALAASLKEDMDDLVTFARKELRRTYFGDHPLATDADGALDHVARMDAPALKSQWQNLVTAQNAVVAVSGDIDTETLLPQLQEELMRLPQKPFAPRPHPLSQAARQGLVQVPREREQSIVLMAFPNPPLRAEDHLAGDILEEIFSDMAGRLFLSVREERNLAYFVGANRLNGLDTGIFVLSAGTHPSSAEAVREEFQQTIARARQGDFTQEELDSARRRLKVALRQSLQSLDSRIMRVALDVLYGFPPDYHSRYDARLDAMTLEDLTAFAQRYLDPETALEMVVGATP